MKDHLFSPNPEAPALVIGAAGVDIIGALKGDLHLGTSNPSRIRSSFGGVARNVAVNLARLGNPVRLIAAVGTDRDGVRLLRDAQEAGVDTCGVLLTSEQPTGSYLGVVDPQGSLQLALDDMAGISTITPEYLRENYQLFKEASLLFVDANLPVKTLRTAISLAQRARIPICADPTSVTLTPKLKPYLKKIKLIIPNTVESGILCGREVAELDPQSSQESAKCLVSLGVEIAIVTQAHLGVCYATSKTYGQIQAIRTKIVDPTGAGDALTGAVLFALLNDIPLDDAIRLGVSAASLTLRYPGAVLPDLTLEKLYDQLVI